MDRLGVKSRLALLEIKTTAGNQGESLMRRLAPVRCPGNIIGSDKWILFYDLCHVACAKIRQTFRHPFFVGRFKLFEINRHASSFLPIRFYSEMAPLRFGLMRPPEVDFRE